MIILLSMFYDLFWMLINEAVLLSTHNIKLWLKGTYQGFSFFIANSFYMSDFMYLLRTQIIFHNVQ